MNQFDVVKDIENIEKDFDNKTKFHKKTNHQLFLNKKSDDFCNDIKLRATDLSLNIEIPKLIDGISQIYIDKKEINKVDIQKNNFSDPESGGIIHIDTKNFPSDIKITGEGELECIWSKNNVVHNDNMHNNINKNNILKNCEKLHTWIEYPNRKSFFQTGNIIIQDKSGLYRLKNVKRIKINNKDVIKIVTWYVMAKVNIIYIDLQNPYAAHEWDIELNNEWCHWALMP